MAVANQKGGVGKSTTAVSLGAALAEAGHRVLVIDLDPQGNASTGLGIRHDAREVTVYDVLAAEADIERAIVQTPVANLFAVPSTIDLAGAEIELVSQFSREMRLRRALEPLRSSAFDFILLDCPPSLGLLTINALAAAEELLVPIQCEYYALEGLGQLLRNVRLVQQNVNPGLRLSGIVMTMFDPRTRLSEQVVAEVRKFFGDLAYRTIIPRTVRLSEAPGFGQPITVYDPKSRGAESYRDLAKEVAARPAPEGPLPVFDEMPTVVVEPVVPAPIARTAPRPLREDAVDDDVELPEPEVEPAEVEPAEVEPAEVESAEVEPEVQAAIVDEPSPADVPEAPHVATPDAAAPDANAPADGEVDVLMSEMRSSDAPSSDAPSSDAPSEARAEHVVEVPGPEPEPEPEEREVVVIDAYGLDPDAVSTPDVEDDGSQEHDDAGRKRWSLFRRGGKR